MTKAPYRYFKLLGKYAELARQEFAQLDEANKKFLQELEDLGCTTQRWFGNSWGVSGIALSGQVDSTIWKPHPHNSAFYTPNRRTKKGRETFAKLNAIKPPNQDGRTHQALAKELGIKSSNGFYHMHFPYEGGSGSSCIVASAQLFGDKHQPYLAIPDDSKCLDGGKGDHSLGIPGLKAGEKFQPPADVIELEEWEYLKLKSEWAKQTKGVAA